MSKLGKSNWKQSYDPLVTTMPLEKRIELAKELIEEMFLNQRKSWGKWKNISGQSDQVDSGYLAQHLISLISGIAGQGLRGKGLDLSDGSEIKSACCVGGIDIPRWNFNFTKDEHMSDLLKVPRIYMVLFDENSKEKLRVRIWIIDPSNDKAFSQVFDNWRKSNRKSRNFQLHPPVNKDSNITTNRSGNLELPLNFQFEENSLGKMEIVLMNDKILSASLITR